eukprot:1471063-Prymnesium_polylepis.1
MSRGRSQVLITGHDASGLVLEEEVEAHSCSSSVLRTRRPLAMSARHVATTSPCCCTMATARRVI